MQTRWVWTVAYGETFIEYQPIAKPQRCAQPQNCPMTQYELVNKVYNENIGDINSMISKSKFPLPFQVLRNFVVKIEDLKKGLENLEKAQSFYSSQALVRILNEHFLVAFYMFTKARVDRNDDCASDYLEYYPIFEMIKRDNYNLKLDKSYNSKKTPLENFLTNSPELRKHINETDIPELNKKANQFDVRNILKYFQNELSNDDAYKSLDSLVMNDCRQYNATSTYIHAGRLAEIQFIENTPPTDRAQEMRKNAQLGEIYSKHTLSFVMLLLLIENPEFAKTYQPVIDSIRISKSNLPS